MILTTVMERVKVEDIDFTDHEVKCRLCFKVFSENEHRVEISKVIEKKFKEITQTKVNKTRNKIFKNSKHSFVSADNFG